MARPSCLYPVDAGAYRVVYTTRDESGAEFTTSEQVVVAGARRTPLALPELLRFDRSTVRVGETARLFVFTGFRAQEMVLEVFRDGAEGSNAARSAPAGRVWWTSRLQPATVAGSRWH